MDSGSMASMTGLKEVRQTPTHHAHIPSVWMDIKELVTIDKHRWGHEYPIPDEGDTNER